MVRSAFRVACCFASLIVLSTVCHAAAAVDGVGATPQELFRGARFDAAIPTQEQVLGVRPGARPLRHDELMRFLEALDEASPRATIKMYSRTHEGRRLVYLAVSDEATIASLDDFREAHAARLDPRGRPASDDATILAGARAVAWMAYGIHGDELSSVDAAAALAYWLVAGEDDVAQRMRRELLVLIDPCENPDGRERYLAQTTSFAHALPNPDQEDLSHTTVWPWGRGNHYLFDLNRDWFSMVQPESLRSVAIASWNPQLMVDSHEMGDNSTYLFSPPRHPFNPHLPLHNMKWAEVFGRDQARALDERGYPYFTREWNEEFFPGYGSAWASYIGAVGILYEMSGTSGTLVRQRGGTLRTFTQAVEHQVASSVSNLTTLLDNRAAILRDFVSDRRSAMRQATQGPVGAWILPEGRHPERTRKLVELLDRQGIEVLRNGAGKPTLDGLRDALTGREVSGSSLPGTVWMVPTDQLAGPMVRVLMDPHVPMSAEFFREEREYIERGKGTRLYEVTAWSLPLSYGVEAYWTPRRPAGNWKIAAVEAWAGGLANVSDPFGYFMDGISDRTVPALAALLQQGVHVRVAEKPVVIGGREWPQGSFLVAREGNPEDLEQRLIQVSQRFRIEVQAVSTAKAERGPDLGGSHFKQLIEPRVGIWTGSPVSPSSYGALWHLMDQELGLRFSGLDVSRFRRADLSRYNVLVFPSTLGGGGAYRALLGEVGVKQLKRWIEDGGSAIGIGSGAQFLADVDNGLTMTRVRSQALDRHPPVVLGLGAVEAQAAGPFVATGLRAGGNLADMTADAEGKKRTAKPAPTHSTRISSYDVAPVLGAGARPFAVGHDQGSPVEMTPVDLADWLKPVLPPGKSKADDDDLKRADERLRRFSPRGTFVRIELDSQIWLTWGLPDELPALVRARDTLVAEPPVQVAARFADLDELHLGGLLWPEAAGRLAHTAYLTREGVGRGQVILFLNEPEFRGWTLATRRLLTNAMLFGPGLGTRWSNPW